MPNNIISHNIAYRAIVSAYRYLLNSTWKKKSPPPPLTLCTIVLTRSNLLTVLQQTANQEKEIGKLHSAEGRHCQWNNIIIKPQNTVSKFLKEKITKSQDIGNNKVIIAVLGDPFSEPDKSNRKIKKAKKKNLNWTTHQKLVFKVLWLITNGNIKGNIFLHIIAPLQKQSIA